MMLSFFFRPEIIYLADKPDLDFCSFIMAAVYKEKQITSKISSKKILQKNLMVLGCEKWDRVG